MGTNRDERRPEGDFPVICLRKELLFSLGSSTLYSCRHLSTGGTSSTKSKGVTDETIHVRLVLGDLFTG